MSITSALVTFGRSDAQCMLQGFITMAEVHLQVAITQAALPQWQFERAQ